MRLLLAALALLVASPAFATVYPNYAILAPSPVAPGTGGRTVACGLTIDPSTAGLNGGRGYYPIVFDCLSQPAFVQLRDGQNGAWTVSLVNPVNGRRCYAVTSDMPGHPNRKALAWNCQNYQRTRFRARLVNDSFQVSAGGCGAAMSSDERSFNGVNQTFQAFLNCNDPDGLRLKFKTRSELASLEDANAPITGSGCPLMSGGPGSGDAFATTFRAACAFKDVCYANPWKGKNRCDDAFLERLTLTCEQRFETDATQRGACLSAAQRYLLRAVGDITSYDERQRKVRNAIRRGLFLLRYL